MSARARAEAVLHADRVEGEDSGEEEEGGGEDGGPELGLAREGLLAAAEDQSREQIFAFGGRRGRTPMTNGLRRSPDYGASSEPF